MGKAEQLMKIERDDVLYVYSGKANRCCCGCSGNYRYNSKYKDLGTKDRGYEVKDDEVNDKQVARVLTIMKNNADKLEEDYDDNLFSVQVDNRLYMVRLVKGE